MLEMSAFKSLYVGQFTLSTQLTKPNYPVMLVAIKEKRHNRRGDFSLKVACEYIFEGDDLFCERLHQKDRSAVLVYMCLVLIVFVLSFERPHALVAAI